MTLIKATEDPGEFSFEILNEEKQLIEVLHVNIVEVSALLIMGGKITGVEKDDIPELVKAIKQCGRPKDLVERLDDHVLVAKLSAAQRAWEQLGKDSGSPRTSLLPTASPSVRRGSPMPNMSTA